MSALPPRFPPRQVPVLTEVIEVPELLDGDVAAVVTDEAAEPPALPLVAELPQTPAWAEVAPVPAAPEVVPGAVSEALSQVPPALSALLEQPPIPTPGSESWGLQEQVGHAGQVGSTGLDEAAAPANDWARNVPSLADVPAPELPLPVQAAAYAEPPVAAVAQEAGLQAFEADDQLTQRVLHEVQRHIDLMLEYRLRQVLGPILARAADGIVKDARQDLAATLRDVVARAVTQELARQRGK